jgi:hypothetical protein
MPSNLPRTWLTAAGGETDRKGLINLANALRRGTGVAGQGVPSLSKVTVPVAVTGSANRKPGRFQWDLQAG